jgi:hypothetical protein
MIDAGMLCAPAARLSAGPDSTIGSAPPAATLRPKLPDPAAAAVRVRDTSAVPEGLATQGPAHSSRTAKQLMSALATAHTGTPALSAKEVGVRMKGCNLPSRQHALVEPPQLLPVDRPCTRIQSID